MSALFTGELGLMISSLLMFAGMADFMIATLFLSDRQPRSRSSDIVISPEQKERIVARNKRQKLLRFSLNMSGALMVAAGLYGIALQILGMFQ